MLLSTQLLRPLYSTSLIVPWFRLLGAEVGSRCEIASAVYSAPDLIEMGDECFVADTVYLGLPAVHMGTIRLAHIRLGNRVFVGNGACLPMQTVLGSNTLVGVMSAPPLAHALDDSNAVTRWPEPALRAEPGTAWLGSPAMFLPARQRPARHFSDEMLYRPSLLRSAARYCFELVKITLPLTTYTFFVLLQLGMFELLRSKLWPHFSTQESSLEAALQSGSWQFWLVWPFLYMAAGMLCAFIALLAKWLLVGKYIAGEHPLFSTLVWRHDIVTAMLESLVHPYFITMLRGTPFISFWFRLLGAEVGARVFLDTTHITEPDLVHIGNDVAVHADAQIQTHLFEDRVLKVIRNRQQQ